MNLALRYILIITSFLWLLFLIRTIIKNKLDIKFSILWIFLGIFIFLIGLFPEIIYLFSRLIGIEIPSNAVFLLMFFIIYCLVFYLYLKISKHNQELLNLNYEIAILKSKIRGDK